MKFAEKFNSYILPKWDRFYLPYDRLMVLLKRATRSSPGDFKEFDSCLQTSIGVLENFFIEHHVFLREKESSIRAQYASDKSGSEKFQARHPLAFDDAQPYYARLQNDYLELQSFARFNQEAVGKLLIKLKKVDPERAELYQKKGLLKNWDSLHHETECVDRIKELPGLMARIDSGRQNSAFAQRLNDNVPSVLYDSEQSATMTLPRISSDHSDASLPRVLEITSDLLQQLDIPISPGNFRAALKSRSHGPFRQPLKGLICCGAWKCAIFLLESGFVPEISEEKDCLEDMLNLEDCLYILTGIICWGPKPLGHSKRSPQSVVQVTEEEKNLFQRLMRHLGPRGQHFLQTPSEIPGRLPLHDCSESGAFAMCCLMADFSRQYERGSSAAFAKLIMTESFEGFTPLQLAVIAGHIEVVQLFISILEEQASTDRSPFKSALSYILLKAVQLQNDAMIQLVAVKDVDITYQSSHNGETALHVAARLGREDYARELLRVARQQITSVDRPDSVQAWTPLFVASASGNLPIVELFIHAGADKTWTDHAGWTAQEHAAFRGHLAVAEKLRSSEAKKAPELLQPVFPKAQKADLSSDLSHFVITLGPMQQNRRAVDHDFQMLQQKFPDAALSIEIASLGRPSKSETFRYPFSDDITSRKLLFSFSDPGQEHITFMLWRNDSTFSDRELLCSGMAALRDNRSCFGPQRESLIREHSVHMFSRTWFGLLGSISFTSVEIVPYPGLNTPQPSNSWNSVQIHGHRGNGQNLGNQKYLQLGENTIGSFLSAAKHGATHVEFDVQVTRDLVPVLYHDFSLSESGTDIPIHDLTYQQFMYASNVQSPRGDPLSMLGKVQPPQQKPTLARARTRSLTRDQEKGAKEVQDRMQFTVDYQAKRFKPNTRGQFIQDTFATLEEALVEVPEHVGFNIEIKYPRIHEALNAGVSPIALDINIFIDTILATIERCTTHSGATPSTRPIVLTSFTPEVCILLAHKQKAFPILFITNGGKQPVEDHDVRAQSVQSATRFARQWGLDGVVFAADVFDICPGLIRWVRSKGLRCGSYGGLNAEVDVVEKQVRAGIDVLIADRVGLVRDVVERVRAERGESGGTHE
ncbi:Glycerophosphoryl diester phosphodiesterase family-domain-containing protein [Phyllosticta citriasiana]|uniref:Glycerophosphoryl diester phosphodiesterase family-domain-containing protein n=1 Tax=Phyllosticta citriasiana TaxID=595635 RepID=UPI0030FDCE54